MSVQWTSQRNSLHPIDAISAVCPLFSQDEGDLEKSSSITDQVKERPEERGIVKDKSRLPPIPAVTAPNPTRPRPAQDLAPAQCQSFCFVSCSFNVEPDSGLSGPALNPSLKITPRPKEDDRQGHGDGGGICNWTPDGLVHTRRLLSCDSCRIRLSRAPGNFNSDLTKRKNTFPDRGK